MQALFALCVALAPLLVSAVQCPAGFEDLGLGDNYCYKYSTDDTYTWTTAYTSCLTSTGGIVNLLSVANVQKYYPQYYEVRSKGGEFWTGLLQFGGNRSWADGTPYNSSLDQFFADDAGDDLYGYLSGEDGLFRFGDGNTKRRFACYVDNTPEPKPTTTTPSPPRCPENWDEYKGVCYFFSTEKQYGGSAGHACHEQEAELISFHDSSLVTYLLLSADPSTIYWTGLEDQNSTYVWEDGTPTDDVTAVVGPYMDDWSEGNDCVAMASGDFPQPFQHKNCFTELNYICYRDVASQDSFVPEADFWL